MDLIAFFQTTDWGFWGVIVTAIIGLITISIAIIAIIKSQKRKSLSYEIITETKLITIHEEAKERLEILFDGKPVKDVSLLVFKIINDGNIPITSTDFEVPLTLVFDEKAEILSSEIIETSEDSLKPKISHTKNKISFSPTLLNAKDDFQVKSLILGYENEFTIDTRIVGVKSVSKTRYRFNFREFIFLAILASFFAIVFSMLPSIGISIKILWILFAIVAGALVSILTTFVMKFFEKTE